MLTELDLTDVTVVGLSLGTGELARYIGTYGTGRLRSCVFWESLAPSFVKSATTRPGSTRPGLRACSRRSSTTALAWLTGMDQNFLNLDENLGTRVSADTERYLWQTGMEASAEATWACPRGWLEDFSADITKIDVPTLIMHGTADRILPIDGQGRRLTRPSRTRSTSRSRAART